MTVIRAQVYTDVHTHAHSRLTHRHIDIDTDTHTHTHTHTHTQHTQHTQHTHSHRHTPKLNPKRGVEKDGGMASEKKKNKVKKRFNKIKRKQKH